MSRSARSTAWGFVASLVFTSAACAGDDSAALLDRFRAEGPIGWARLEERDDELTYRVQFSSTTSWQSGNYRSRLSLIWVRRPGCLRVEVVELEGTNEGRTTALVHTDHHMFHVSRSKGGATWRLVSAGDMREKSDILYLLAPMIGLHIVRPTTTFIAGTPYRFLDFKGDPTIKFSHARWDGDGIRIDFQAAGQAHMTKKAYETHGSIEFDPNNHWAMRSSELQRPSDGLRVRVENSFGEPDRHGFRPIIARREEHIGQTGSLVQEFRYDLTETGPAPAERFRLADFGLPDPLGPLPRRFPTAYVLTGAGLVCLVVALWFARRARRARLGTPDASAV